MALTIEPTYSLEIYKLFVASIIGATSYFIFCLLERKEHSVVLIGATLIAIFGFFLPVDRYSSLSKFEQISIFSLTATIPCLLGSPYHQKLDGIPRTRGYSFVLLFASALLSFLLGSIPYEGMNLTYGVNITHVYPFSLIAYPP